MPDPAPTLETGTPAETAPDEISPEVRSLMTNLFDSVDEDGNEKPKVLEKPKEPEKKPEVKVEVKPGEKPVDAKEDQPIRVRREKVKRPDLPAPVGEEEQKPQTVETPTKPDPKWESELSEDDREMLADARYMEERFPDRYKGWAAKTERFIRDYAAKTGEEGFDPESPVYKAWLAKAQPKLSRAEIREIQETRVADRIEKEQAKKYSDLNYKLFVREEEPKIEAERQRLQNELINLAAPDEVVEGFKKMGVEKAAAAFKMELRVIEEVASTAASDIAELDRLSRKDPESGRPLVTPAVNESDPKWVQHMRLSTMVKSLCEGFKANAPQNQQVRDGKWFATRDEYKRMTPAQRQNWWTFTNKELVNLAKPGIKAVVAQRIKAQIAELEGHGFKRVLPTSETPAAPVKTQTASTPRPSAAPATGDPNGGETNPQVAQLLASFNRD